MKKKDLVVGQTYADHRDTKVILVDADNKWEADRLGNYGYGPRREVAYTLPDGTALSGRFRDGGTSVIVAARYGYESPYHLTTRTLGQIKAVWDEEYEAEKKAEADARVAASKRQQEAAHRREVERDNRANRLTTVLNITTLAANYGDSDNHIDRLLDLVDDLSARLGQERLHVGDYVETPAPFPNEEIMLRGKVRDVAVSIDLDDYNGVISRPVRQVTKISDATAPVHTLPKDN